MNLFDYRYLAGALCALSLTHPGDVVYAEPGQITPPIGRSASVHLSPRLLQPGDAGIGRLIPDLQLAGVDGLDHRLYEAGAELGTVVVVRDPACPVSRRYGPRIRQLAETYQAKGFGFVFIYPSIDLSTEQRAQDAAFFDIKGIFAERGSFGLAEQLGVKSTGDVFVIDGTGHIRYRGAVDDQYGLGYTRDTPTANYLRNALDDLLGQRDVKVPATAAPGCYIDADPALDSQLPNLPGGHALS
jgi:hypothetical protein